ncbi:hypothetical protein [Clostridium beijerinckii]|nr:hypothetical protein [Clostridium beijerinckii]
MLVINSEFKVTTGRYFEGTREIKSSELSYITKKIGKIYGGQVLN